MEGGSVEVPVIGVFGQRCTRDSTDFEFCSLLCEAEVTQGTDGTVERVESSAVFGTSTG